MLLFYVVIIYSFFHALVLFKQHYIEPKIRHAEPFVFVVGLPKSGTTSLHKYFECGGLHSSHWTCGDIRCGECIEQNILKHQTPLLGCGSFDVYTQMDVVGDGNHSCYFPQLSALDIIYETYPNATYIFNTRPFAHWNRSIHNWYNMHYRLREKCIWPFSFSKNQHFFKQLHEYTTNTIHTFHKTHTSMNLLEIDIESSSAGEALEDWFGIPQKCWQKRNASPKS